MGHSTLAVPVERLLVEVENLVEHSLVARLVSKIRFAAWLLVVVGILFVMHTDRSFPVSNFRQDELHASLHLHKGRDQAHKVYKNFGGLDHQPWECMKLHGTDCENLDHQHVVESRKLFYSRLFRSFFSLRLFSSSEAATPAPTAAAAAAAPLLRERDRLELTLRGRPGLKLSF